MSWWVDLHRNKLISVAFVYYILPLLYHLTLKSIEQIGFLIFFTFFSFHGVSYIFVQVYVINKGYCATAFKDVVTNWEYFQLEQFFLLT